MSSASIARLRRSSFCTFSIFRPKATLSSTDPECSEGAEGAAPSVEPTASGAMVRSGAEEVVPALRLIDALGEVGVPGRVVTDALAERPTVAHRALLDVAHLPRDAGQIAGGRLAEVPEVVLVGLERDASGRIGRTVLGDPPAQRGAVADVVALAHDRGAEPAVVHPVQVVVAGLQLRRI